MPLINLQTNLKSLRYGADRQGGGDSGLPYIQTNIERANPGIKFDDGLVRGGTVNAAVAGIIDTSRIFKFLKDPPKGPLFIVKQVGLQLSNPRLEVPKNPANIASGLPDNVLSVGTNGLLQPTRIYNLGINTLAQIPVNAFGAHLNRHGLLPVQTKASTYEAVVTANNDLGGSSKFNRLVGLTNKFRLGDRTPNLTINNRIANVINIVSQAASLLTGATVRPINVTPQDLIIDQYAAGPNSVYGIGRTTINRYYNSEDSFKINVLTNFSKTYAGKTRNQATGAPESLNLAQDKGTGTNAISTYPKVATFGNNEVNTALNLNAVRYNPALKTYLAVQTQTKTEILQDIPDTGKYTATPYNNKGYINTVNPQVDRDPSEPYRYYGRRVVSDNRSVSKYNNTDVFSRNDSSILTVVFRGLDPFSGNEETWLFNGYISGYKDNFNATWNDVNYNGRAESFYVYNKFKRSVSFNLQMPCFNKTQLFEKHRALGQLASTTAGSYNEKGILGGVLLKVNVGKYLVGEYAILNSLSYDIPADASWDIADDALLSMYLNVSIDLTIINNKLPQYQPETKDPESGFFGYLPNLVNPSAQRGAGYITPTKIVNKFVNYSSTPNTESPGTRTQTGDVTRPTPTLPPSVPTQPNIVRR
jgi:hypothetical protein